MVLSCCEGGLGNDTLGSEPVSLAGGLSAAGAQTLIVNLWKVDDEVALLTFTEFYRQLGSGQPVHLAFRAALAACRARYPRPSDWGGFCLLGNPR